MMEFPEMEIPLSVEATVERVEMHLWIDARKVLLQPKSTPQ